MGLLSSDDIKIFTALAEGVKEDPEAAIKEVLAKLPGNLEGYPYLTAILLIDGLSGVGEEVTLLTSYLFNKELKIVGGMAGDDFKMEKTFYILGLETEKEEEYKIRWPSGINEDGSLNFKCGIAEGAIFCILEPGSSAAFHNTTSVVLLLPKGDKE